MFESSDPGRARLENEVAELRTEICVLRTVLGAIVANSLASRGRDSDYFDAIRAQAHTGLIRIFAQDETPEIEMKFHRAALNGFLDQLADQLDISQTNRDRTETS